MARSVVHINGGAIVLMTDTLPKFEETSDFKIPGSEVVVKLRPLPHHLYEGNTPLVQVVLVEPPDDVVSVILDGSECILSSDSSSMSMNLTPKSNDVKCKSDMFSITYYSMAFRLKVDRVPVPWKRYFLNLTPAEAPDVTVRVDGRDIPTTEKILTTKSDVFKAMFTHETKEKQARVVEISDFSFAVVQEMIRFMMYNYCCLWGKKYKKLSAIADKYNVIGMKELAQKKKLLIDKRN